MTICVMTAAMSEMDYEKLLAALEQADSQAKGHEHAAWKCIKDRKYSQLSGIMEAVERDRNEWQRLMAIKMAHPGQPAHGPPPSVGSFLQLPWVIGSILSGSRPIFPACGLSS